MSKLCYKISLSICSVFVGKSFIIRHPFLCYLKVVTRVMQMKSYWNLGSPMICFLTLYHYLPLLCTYCNLLLKLAGLQFYSFFRWPFLKEKMIKQPTRKQKIQKQKKPTNQQKYLGYNFCKNNVVFQEICISPILRICISAQS